MGAFHLNDQGERSTCVSFRLRRRELEALDELAAAENSSRGQVVKSIIVRFLRGGGGASDDALELPTVLPELFAEVEALHQAHTVTQRRLIDVLETVLCNTTSATHEQIREWVRSRFETEG